MTVKATAYNCTNGEHQWESEEGCEDRYTLGGLGETVEKRVICKLCSIRGREIWIYSDTIAEG